MILSITSEELTHIDTLTKTAHIESYKTAKHRDISFIDQRAVLLLPGEYDFQATLICSSKIETRKEKISLPKIEQEKLLLSDIELAVAAYPETTKSPFSKYGLTVIPNPSRIFGGQWKIIYPYFEVYNLKPDSSFYDVVYKVKSSSGKIVKKDVERTRKVFVAQNEVIGIDLAGLGEGDYILEVSIVDTSARMEVARSREFKIGKSEPMVTVTDKYDNLIISLLGDVEYQRYKRLPPQRKLEFIEKFKKSDVYLNYQGRVDYVNEHFKVGSKSGWKTDRGRLYIKYGQPDEIVSKTFEEIKPIKHWIYYSNGLHFIFMDLTGDGDYRLVWSNSKDDPGYPNWERYLPYWAIEEY